MNAELLTASQVGHLLDVDTSTVYRMAGDGRLPAVRVGRQWRFPADGIEQSLRVGIPASAPNGVLAGTPPAVLGGSAEVAATVVDLVAESLGVMMVVTDMDGRPVTEVANPCPWFEAHASDPGVLDECVEEWRDLAHGTDLTPRFARGRHGFLCARAFVRQDHELVGMVLAGGIAPDPAVDTEGLHVLDEAERNRALRMLPRVAAALSRLTRSPGRNLS